MGRVAMQFAVLMVALAVDPGTRAVAQEPEQLPVQRPDTGLREEILRQIEQGNARGGIARVPPIPSHALYGVMAPPRGRQTLMSNRPVNLAPGCRIYGVDNRIVLPSAMRQPALVRFTLDQYGQLLKVWLLPADTPIVAPLPRRPTEREVQEQDAS